MQRADRVVGSQSLAALVLAAAPVCGQGAQPVPPGPLPSLAVVEAFQDISHWDLFASGAEWGGGKIVPGLIGGNGELGDFVHTDGRSLGTINGLDTYEWSTDRQPIPAARTVRGVPVVVTDGVFRFASFVVPAGVRVVFRGTKPAQVLVSGTVLLGGVVDASAEDLADGFDGRNPGRIGQSGSLGGPGAGFGGNGSDGGAWNAPPPGDGGDGDDVLLPPGHPYAAFQRGTGGHGSAANPPGADRSKICYSYFNFFSHQMASGGGGGSLYDVLGGAGKYLNTQDPCEQAPDTPSGNQLFLRPVQRVTSSVVQFLIPGCGGGGGGTNPYLSSSTAIDWHAAAGGGGGGGALRFEAGYGFATLSNGQVRVRGGSSGSVKITGNATPGGGGSGGSCLIQTRYALFQGDLDLLGGRGGSWQDQTLPNRVIGGDGGPGYVRVETPVPLPPSALGSVQPPATVDNVGPLLEENLLTQARSLWYRAQPHRRQSYLRYEIEADIGGVPVRYSDEPSRGLPAVPGFAPIGFFLQGATLDAVGQPVPGSLTPWRLRAADLSQQDGNAFRWLLWFDRGYLGSSVPLVVRRVSVWMIE